MKIQYNRNRYYDYYTGRWLTQDPSGINPAGSEGNPFLAQKEDKINYKLAIRPDAAIPPEIAQRILQGELVTPQNQYVDGMSLYEYAKSNPILLSDPLGLVCGETCKWSGVISAKGWMAIIAGSAKVTVFATGIDECGRSYSVMGKGSGNLVTFDEKTGGSLGPGIGWLKASVEFEDVELPCKWPLNNGDMGEVWAYGLGGTVGIGISIALIYGEAGSFHQTEWGSVGGIGVFAGIISWYANPLTVTHTPPDS